MSIARSHSRFLEQMAVEIPAAEPVVASLAAAVLFGNDLHAETHERPDVGRDEAVARGRCRSRSSSPPSVTLTCTTRGSRARAAASIFWQSATFLANGTRLSGSSAPYIAWLVRCGEAAARPFAGSSSFSVDAARSIAASLISLACAKAVVSPVTPRRPKPEEL